MSTTKQLAEAEELLREVAAWPEDEIQELPGFYREKAEEYREFTERRGTSTAGSD